MENILEVKNMSYSFNKDESSVEVLKGIDLTAEHGEFIAVVGKSGSGKSTLLNLIAGFTRQDEGEIRIMGTDINELSENKKASFRHDNIGFVFQAYNLIQDMTAIENVQLPLEISGMKRKKRYDIALKLLHSMGLDDRKDHYPRELSGGEQQRIAICRAIISEPKLILADEPTGNLDSRAGENIVKILMDIRKKRGATLLLVTHDMDIAKKADRIAYIKDGRIVPYEEF